MVIVTYFSVRRCTVLARATRCIFEFLEARSQCFTQVCCTTSCRVFLVSQQHLFAVSVSRPAAITGARPVESPHTREEWMIAIVRVIPTRDFCPDTRPRRLPFFSVFLLFCVSISSTRCAKAPARRVGRSIRNFQGKFSIFFNPSRRDNTLPEAKIFRAAYDTMSQGIYVYLYIPRVTL